MAPRKPGVDPERKTEALRIAAEHGPAEASRRTGIPVGTIKAWRVRKGQAGPPAGADVAKWQASKRQGAQEAWGTSQEALAQVRESLAAGKTADAQRAALTFAILVDKSGVLEIAAQQADSDALRLDREVGEQIAAVIRAAFDAAGVPMTAAGPMLRELLNQSADGMPLVVSPLHAERVRAAIRERVGAELREEIVGEIAARIEPAWTAERRALPPAGGTVEAPREPLALPRTVVRAVPDPDPHPAPAAAAPRRPREYRFGGRGRYGASEFD